MIQSTADFSLPQAIGNTPLVELTRLAAGLPVRIFAKLEGNNPGGSVKDRPAWYMVKKAEESGLLSPGKTILEPTSGNTGIALAMIGAARGYRVKLVMPACVSMERRAVLEAYGAEVVLSKACQTTDGAIRLAHQIFADDPDRYYMPNQYANPNNPLAHYETTGPEIFPDSRRDRCFRRRHGDLRNPHGDRALSAGSQARSAHRRHRAPTGA